MCCWYVSLFFKIAIFCEGSRFTREKFHQGVQYARDNNLTPLKHHLVPRTKGYAILAKSLKAESEHAHTCIE